MQLEEYSYKTLEPTNQKPLPSAIKYKEVTPVPNHQSMNTHRWHGGKTPHITDSMLDGNKQLTSYSSHFTHRKEPLVHNKGLVRQSGCFPEFSW
jgi:hypothetical protein